jgi:transposase
MRQEILVGPERRRRWSDAEKIAIVLEAASGELSVSDVARRHDITRQQIYQWRSAMRRGRLVDGSGGTFLAVEVADAACRCEGGPPGEPAYDALVEVSLHKGRVLRVPASIPPGVLTSLIRAAEAA